MHDDLHYLLWRAVLPVVSTAIAARPEQHEETCDCCRRLRAVAGAALVAEGEQDRIIAQARGDVPTDAWRGNERSA